MPRIGALKSALLSIVKQYGIVDVKIAIIAIEKEEKSKTSKAATSKTSRRSQGIRKNAVTYVSDMDITPESKKQYVKELAEKFEQKEFCPYWASIEEFLIDFKVDLPASKSRSSAIPRVFKTLATLDMEVIHDIIDNELYSGPSRLGPIADAIRESSQRRISTFYPNQRRDRMPNQHVVPHDDGWAVKAAGSSRATSVHHTQAEAEKEATKIAKNQETELFVHGTDGAIRKRSSFGGESRTKDRDHLK